MDIEQRDKDLLQLGQPPESDAVLDVITVGQAAWEDFLVQHYLASEGYVADGYSQLKFVLGRPGSGKTHLLRRLTGRAHQGGYAAVFLSATDLRLQHVESLYAAIATHLDLQELAWRLARRVAQTLGYALEDVPPKTTFLAWLIQAHDRIDTLVKRDVEQKLGNLFKGERVDPNFSLAFTQLASDVLGTHHFASEDRDLLLQWLRGNKLRAEELHRIHLARGIDRYNARDMLHALADFLRQQGYTGLFVAIDQMDDLPQGTNPETGRRKYGAVALADAYQSLREMVDNLPSVPGMLIVLAGRREFLELPRGIKSYDALWLRIQHEVVSPQFNRFAQVIDLDRAVQAYLSADEVRILHERLTALGLGPRPLDELTVREILHSAAGDGVYKRLIQGMLVSREQRGNHG